MKKKIGVSVVIPNWNGKKLLERNLPHLTEAMDYYGGDYEIIVVDDGSIDGSAQFIRDTFPSIRVIRLERNRGFPIAANRGVGAAIHDLVLLLNSDIRVKKNFLVPLLGYFDEERTFAVSTAIMEDENTVVIRPYVLEFKYGFLREVFATEKNGPNLASSASGGRGLFDRKKFMQLGGFDEIYSPFYYEDWDLSYRAWKKGFRMYYEPQSIVYHAHQATIGKAFSNGYIKFIFNRNRLIFTWKNLTDSDFLFRHFLFLPFFLLRNSIRNPLVFLSFLAALRKVPTILRTRRKEEAFIRHGDKEVLRLIREE
jgi:GT2 family glycosyltransferase